MSQTTSELRIFISSTFHDLREEREYLIKRIFPGIRQLCRERGVELTEIDLRWGLTEEEATQGKIIRTCLEEIDRCRPYFIGIIGDRYGWSPKFHEVQKDAELVRLYPWIEDMSADGASILEMEFEYAVLRDPSRAIGSYFYFRKHPDGYDYETDEHKKIEALKKRTRASKRPAKDFTTLAELGEFVRNDLTRLIELHWHKENSDNPLEIERSSHEAFASTRRRAYILNPEYLKVFNAFIDAESQPAPTTGSGKPIILSIPSLFDYFVAEKISGKLFFTSTASLDSAGAYSVQLANADSTLIFSKFLYTRRKGAEEFFKDARDYFTYIDSI
jgi:hypothetical protein